jgi:hypothetical protein
MVLVGHLDQKAWYSCVDLDSFGTAPDYTIEQNNESNDSCKGEVLSDHHDDCIHMRRIMQLLVQDLVEDLARSNRKDELPLPRKMKPLCHTLHCIAEMLSGKSYSSNTVMHPQAHLFYTKGTEV